MICGVIGQNEGYVVGVENKTAVAAVAAAGNSRAEDESSELGNTQLLARFTFWHAGWIVTDLSRDRVSGFGLPAFFHSVAWDAAKKNLVLTLVPEIIDPKTSPLRVLITGVIGIHVCPSSLRPPGRLLSLETEKGETWIIRLELHLDRRSTYQQYHEPCFKQALAP